MKIYIDFADLPEIFLQASLFFIVYFLFYRKYIYAVFDPLFLYIFTLSFSSVLIVYTLGDTDLAHSFHFFLCHLFFYIGFALVASNFKEDKKIESHSYPVQSFPDYKLLRIVLYSLCGFYYLANIVLFYTSGFALLTDDPGAAKSNYLEKGFAIISNINMAVGSFILAGLFFSLLWKPRYVDFILLIISIALSSLSGAKGALVHVVVIFVLIAKHKLFRSNHKVSSVMKLVTPLGVISIIIVSFFVFSKDSADSEPVLLKFVTRLLNGADSTLYFYQPVNEQYFAHFRFWEYPSFLFSQILAFLRLTPPVEAHGNVMVYNLFPSAGSISGPNTPYYIEGQIYFGYYGAFIYSAFVGCCYAYSRNFFFNTQFSSSFNFVFVSCIVYMASTISTEVTYGFYSMFQVCFFVIPVYILVSFTLYGRVKLTRIFPKRSIVKFKNLNVVFRK